MPPSENPRQSSPIALCPGCSEPLIATFAYSGYEFLCICCGQRVTFFGPRRGDGDDEQLQARMAELQAEWDEHVGARLLPRSGFRLRGCDLCSQEDHWTHITDEERVADEQAREWLKERVA
jgi:hypothetical protein